MKHEAVTAVCCKVCRVQKDWVPLYYSGCTTASIHRRDPTTERHGGFDLLRLRPGPVHPSLDDLVVPSSPRSTISIPNLVRTPDRHSPLQLRAPELKRSSSLSLPVTWITGARHRTRRETPAVIGVLTKVMSPRSTLQRHVAAKTRTTVLKVHQTGQLFPKDHSLIMSDVFNKDT